MKFIHLMHDEKFIDNAIDIFTQLTDEQNIFIVGTEMANDKLKFIRSELAVVMRYDSEAYKNIIRTIKTEDIVVVHYLDLQKAAVLNAISTSPRIVWLSFGAELYASAFYNVSVHLPYTKLLLALNPKNNLRKIRDIFIRFRHTYFSSVLKHPVRAAITKINYLATPLDSEYELFKKYFPDLKATKVFFQYGSLEHILEKSFFENAELGNGIFVGNSNTPASNHVDAFRFIHQFPLKGRKIIVPLSYGGDIFYKSGVIKAGRHYFGSDFEPLDVYLDRATYIKKLSGCSSAVFMHVRQQAIGNIFIALWLGLKVFLLRQNPCYADFRSRGLAVYAIQECTESEWNDPIPPDERLANRQILINEFGRDTVYKKIKIMLSNLTRSACGRRVMPRFKCGE